MQRSLWMIVCVVAGFMCAYETQAFFGDREYSANNQFRAATLDIAL